MVLDPADELPLLFLHRVTDTPLGTFGVVVDSTGEQVCKTGELSWRDNEKYVSCIPPGRYVCRPHKSPSHGDCFIVAGVKGRTDILIHTGNWAGLKKFGALGDTEGCILPGKAVRKIQHSSGTSQIGVTASRRTMQSLLQKYPMGFSLIIESV